MVCIQCGSKTHVYNSRHQKRTNQIWRRRQCLTCNSAFTTEESIDYAGSWRVRYPSGALKPFVRDRLLLSLHRSCQHRKTALSDAQGLTDTVIKKLLSQTDDGIIDSRIIHQISQVALNRFDKAASSHYLVFHREG